MPNGKLNKDFLAMNLILAPWIWRDIMDKIKSQFEVCGPPIARYLGVSLGKCPSIFQPQILCKRNWLMRLIIGFICRGIKRSKRCKVDFTDNLFKINCKTKAFILKYRPSIPANLQPRLCFSVSQISSSCFNIMNYFNIIFTASIP